MKLYFWTGVVPNFGDELNAWLMPKVFPNFFDDEPDPMFLGIGSVLFNYHPENIRKIVFGSGYGRYTSLPNFDDKWKVYCVRGPLTAKACGLGPDKIAGDAAILINKFRSVSAAKTTRCSFMPHWATVEGGKWARACQLANINFIDPRDPVERVLEQIESSEVIVTEAMHGAIVADALRVPWIPVRPFNVVHRFKWDDWAGALDMSVRFQRPWPSSTREAWTALSQRPGLKIDKLRQTVAKPVIQLADRVFVEIAAKWLSRASQKVWTLSSDKALDRGN